MAKLTKTYNGFKVGDMVRVRKEKDGQVYEVNRLWDRFIVELVYTEGGVVYRAGNMDASTLRKA
jgi:hypothetical protein